MSKAARPRKAKRKQAVLETARMVLETESRAVADLAARLDERFDDAVETIVGCAGRVIVSGMGKSGLIGQKIAATFSSTGTPSYFLHPAEALHGDIGMIVKGDVLLALSNSGETEEILRLLDLVRRIGVRIIGMSGDGNSTLARHADCHLYTGVSREACPLDLVPTASTTAALAVGDALAVCCYQRRGFSVDAFRRFHPGGRLGRKLLQVKDLMHQSDELPAVDTDATLAAAVQEMSAKRLGMTCIREGNLLRGVLTDGDLRRALLGGKVDLGDRVARFMTAEPSTIAPDALATEALRIMEEKKITSLPVVEADGGLIGVIQIHDLWRTELF